MNSKIRDIIDFFGKHDASKSIKQKVWRLMLTHREDADADAAYRELWKDAENEGVDGSDIDEAYQRFNDALGPGNIRRHSIKLWWSRIAAVLVPLLILVTFVAFYSVKQQRDIAEDMAMVRRQTAPGDTALVTLPDGSSVKLREGSVLLYPSSFENGERKVYLVGKATFNVRHNEENPLKVVTPYFEITDLGTVFDITSYSDVDESSAAVSSGRIALRISGSNKTYNMSPNDMLVYNVSSGDILTGKYEELSQKWRRTQIIIDDTSFADVAKILSANYDVAIDIRNHQYDNMHVTVHFNKGENLKNAMSVIASLLPGMRYEIIDGKVIVK